MTEVDLGAGREGGALDRVTRAVRAGRTRERTRRVHRSASERARRFHLPAVIARAIADGVVAELTTGPMSAGRVPSARKGWRSRGTATARQ